jgi:CheY-like chemotaxis protein
MLHIQVYDTPQFEQHARVNDSGNLPLLFLGDVRVAAETPAQAANTISARLISDELMTILTCAPSSPAQLLISEWTASPLSRPKTFLTSDVTLVVLDLLMPKTDGIEILRILGQNRCPAGIILMSGVGKRVIQTAEEFASSLGISIVGHLT